MTLDSSKLPRLIPRELLFGNPTQTNPTLSPDGSAIAYLAPLNGVLNLWVRTCESDSGRAVTQDADRGIRSFFWGHDNRTLFYVQDAGGNENFRLYSVDSLDGGVRERTPYDNVQVRIIGRSIDHPDLLYIGLNLTNPKNHDVYILNLQNDELQLAAENPGNVTSWLVDRQFRLRGAMRVTADGGSELLTRTDEQAEWESTAVWNADDSSSSRPVSFSADGGSIYMIDARGVNAGRLVCMNLATSEIEVIAEDDTYDVSGVLFHPDTYQLEAVLFTKAKQEWVIVNDSLRSDFAKLSRLHSGELFIKSRDRADKKWIIGFMTDTGPTPFYLYDRTTGETAFLFYTKPALAEYELAPMQPISFRSRDGLTIHGYLTVPPGVSGPLPTVLCVHGGPWSRDHWGYNAQAQWFANRGYACLQVNFRGSTGYGKHFVNAGDREWGGRMHDDLVDAVGWAIERNYTDPRRVAIFGGSYGGYAALVGATFTPELFCCAVDIVGPSSIPTLIRSIPPYWSPMLARLHKRVGNPDTDEAFLQSRSPLYKVDQIRIPILIAQGANDPRVKQAESEQIVEAMKRKGIDYEYMLFPDEGHGFAKPNNRKTFYEAAERFLAKHLGGRFEEEKQARFEAAND